MIGFGAMLPVFAAWRYHVVNTAIEKGKVEADRTLVVAMTAVVFLLGVAIVVYLVITANGSS